MPESASPVRLSPAATAVEIVRELPSQMGFQVLPRRWAVERFCQTKRQPLLSELASRMSIIGVRDSRS